MSCSYHRAPCGRHHLGRQVWRQVCLLSTQPRGCACCLHHAVLVSGVRWNHASLGSAQALLIDHGQPVMGIFHRPRAEAELISDQGFDPRSASFQFLNISNADMGPWMQQLVTQEGWLRSTVEIAPVPFSLDIPNQRPFEKHSILCFRHPSLPPLEKYFLPYPIHALIGRPLVFL